MSEKEYVRKEAEAWKKIREKYGSCTYIDDVSQLKEIDPKRIWTEYWRTDQYITNDFSEAQELDGELTGYYVFERPYEEPRGTLFLVTTFWEDCQECKGEDDECDKCEGRGSIAIDVS